MDPSAMVRLRPADGPESSWSESVRALSLVRGALDVASASPGRYLFEVFSHFTSAEHEKERLEYFASAEGRDDLWRYCGAERRTLLEVCQHTCLLPLAPAVVPAGCPSSWHSDGCRGSMVGCMRVVHV